MKWSTYKQLCDRPDYWSRWMLEQCIDLLAQLHEESLRGVLEQALQGEALPVPEDHRGPVASAMYHLMLSGESRLAMVSAISKARELGLYTAQTEGRGLAGFVEAWQEYAEYGG